MVRLAAAVDIQTEEGKYVGTELVCFYCVSAGGTQALICIDLPLLLTITLLHFYHYYSPCRILFARTLWIFQVTGGSLESCVEL